MFEHFFEKLFCKHNYSVIKNFNCTCAFDDIEGDFPVTLLECTKCKERKVIKSATMFYKKSLLELLYLWETHQLEEFEI